MRVAIVQLLERTNDQAIVDQTIGVARHDAFCDRIEEKALAVEYGPQGIRVNALLPGGTQTAAADMMADTEEMKAFVRNMHALKRIAAPEEQARAALFLASDAATFVTGSAMLVDGGVSISKT
jgi:enoyl-[acyl-carrier-protein] reductase (NADH)